MILALLLAASSWVPVTSDIRHQVVDLQVRHPETQKLRSFCTGVVVQLRPVVWILTESHCLSEPYDKMDIYADGILIEEVRRKDEVSLMTTKGSGIGRSDKWRVMPVRKDPPRPGTPVLAAGFGFGMYLVTTGIVAGYGLDDRLIYLNIEFFAGMSGGPVVDDQGRLVSLVRGVAPDADGSPNAVAFGADTPTIWAVLQPNR